MDTQQDLLNYKRIAAAIEFVQEHFQEQPSLAVIAEHVHLSADHFQRLFQEWAGTSPKKFLQYTSIQYAKKILSDKNASLSETTFQTGLSSNSRLHDLFVNIEAMSPAEYKNGGRNLEITVAKYPSLFGNLVVASTPKGICYLAFDDDNGLAIEQLYLQYPLANFRKETSELHYQALSFFQKDWKDPKKVQLHLRGTGFQLKVWEALLKIPASRLSSYQQIAMHIEHSKSARAVGNAIGANPIAFIIPCHRVIQTSGLLGGYRWGSIRKKALIAWEGVNGQKPDDGTF